MLRDDFLLRQIEQFAQAIAGLRANPDDVELFQQAGDLLTQVTGVSLSTLDRLPPVAVVGMLTASGREEPGRLLAVAELLELLAEREEAHADARLQKAALLRRAASV